MVIIHFDSFEVNFISAPALEAVVSEAVETVLNWPETCRSCYGKLNNSLVIQLVKYPPALQETWEDPLEKRTTTHSNSGLENCMK